MAVVSAIVVYFFLQQMHRLMRKCELLVCPQSCFVINHKTLCSLQLFYRDAHCFAASNKIYTIGIKLSIYIQQNWKVQLQECV